MIRRGVNAWTSGLTEAYGNGYRDGQMDIIEMAWTRNLGQALAIAGGLERARRIGWTQVVGCLA